MSDPKMIKEIMDTVSIPVSHQSLSARFHEQSILNHGEPAISGYGQVAYRPHCRGRDSAGDRRRLHRRVSSTGALGKKKRQLSLTRCFALLRSEVLTPADPALHVDKHVSLTLAVSCSLFRTAELRN